MTAATDRQLFREAVAAVAEKAKAILPSQVNGRVESAVTLVLLGEVQPQEDGSIHVGSTSDPAKVYHLQGTSCDCADFPRAPQSWCKHRIAAGIHRRVHEVLAAQEHPYHGKGDTPVPPPLPEAPASVNCHITIEGRQVQLTLRDSDEGRLLARVEAVLAQYPQPEKATDDTAKVCPKHGVPMRQTSKDGKSWWSHKTSEGWCKGR